MLNELAGHHGLPGPYEVDPDKAQSLRMRGQGAQIDVSIQDQPLDDADFAVALRAPILKIKKFDFKAAVAEHRAAVVITVTSDEANAEQDTDTPADAFVKLTLLHLALQQSAAFASPLMVDFRPSQSLLSPEEFATVATLGLPVPILFHPFPVGNGKTASGKPRRGMAAIHAPMLIGAELELEAIPFDMKMPTRIAFLSDLVALKLDRHAALAHGDCLKAPDGRPVWVRHVEGATTNEPHRIIVSFDTQAPEIRSTLQIRDQTSFQERVERLKARAQPGLDAGTPTPQPVFQESEDDLRARVQETIVPTPPSTFVPGSLVRIPLVLMATGALLVAVVLSGVGRNLAVFDLAGVSAAQSILTAPPQQDGLPAIPSLPSTGATFLSVD
jgi:hypothetical protein